MLKSHTHPHFQAFAYEPNIAHNLTDRITQQKDRQHTLMEASTKTKSLIAPKED